jgi:hypothetical protein
VSCVPSIVAWALKAHAKPSAPNPAQRDLDSLWRWVGYFVDVFALGITNEVWETVCCTAITVALSMLENDQLVTVRGAEVMLAFWLSLGKDPVVRARLSKVVTGTPLRDTFRLTMNLSTFIMRICSESNGSVADQAIRRLLGAAEQPIVEFAFRNLDTHRLDVAATHGRARVWEELVVDLTLITTLHQDYSFVLDRAELFSTANARSVMRILSWLTDRSPAQWRSASSKTLGCLSRSVQQGLLYIEALFLDPCVYGELPRLIRDGLAFALTRARVWLRPEWEFMGSLKDRLDGMDRDLVRCTWFWPVYAALDSQQLSSSAGDLHPKIMARLQRWTPAKALFCLYLAGGMFSPLWGPPSKSTKCDYSRVRGLFRSCLAC